MRMRNIAGLLGTALVAAGCSLDVTNPNSPTEEAVLTNAEGVVALGVGLQTRYANSLGALIYDAGLLTDELAATRVALINVRQGEQGIVENNAGLVADLWNSNYRTIKTANDIIAAAPNVTLPAGTRSGLLALAYTLKAGAIGELLQGFQQVALNTSSEAPQFVPRSVALDTVLALLDSAGQQLAATPPSAQFTSQVLSRGFDLPNTRLAFKARYLRLAGQYEAALAAADSVDLSVFSTLSHTPQAPNPVFVNSAGSSSVLPRRAFRLAAPAEEASRVAYHVTPGSGLAFNGFLQPNDAWTQFVSVSSRLPVYYPDEMLLIKAEALVELGQLTAAVAAIDSVRTDCTGATGRPAGDPKACLGPYAGPVTAEALLEEIYRNRKYELYGTGLRWEDARRLGSVGGSTTETGGIARRCWLPYPIGERNANPANVPEDPEGIDPPAFPTTCTTT